MPIGLIFDKHVTIKTKSTKIMGCSDQIKID